jgi:hypothetical protein
MVLAGHGFYRRDGWKFLAQQVVPSACKSWHDWHNCQAHSAAKKICVSSVFICG